MTTAAALMEAYGRIQEDLERVEAIVDKQVRSDQPEVAILCRHLARFRGKMLRPALLLLSAKATGTIRPIHLGLAAVVEMFHLATLIHDDVLDEASARRQTASINRGWGNEAAVMLGDWLISHAYHLCSKQGSQWANLEISLAAHRVCEGELSQLFRRGDWDLSVEDYLAILRAKTGALTGLAARLGARFNEAGPAVETACLNYGLDLGVAFQIVDDLLDLVGEEQEVGKTLGSDLAKGKATLPLIHLLTRGGGNADRVRDLLDRMSGDGRPQDETEISDLIAEVRRIVLEAGCLDSAEAVAVQFVRSAREHLSALPPSESRGDLEKLADFVLVRTR